MGSGGARWAAARGPSARGEKAGPPDSAGPAKREKEERVARLGRWADGRSGPGC